MNLWRFVEVLCVIVEVYNIAFSKTHLKYYFYSLLLFSIEITRTLLVCKFLWIFSLV